MRFLRTYFLPILIAFAMLLFFTHDFGLIDIEHTAIIVALGVDKNKENTEYEISVQIAIPQASADNASESESVISAKGQTIGEALDKIAVNTGWYPLFSFCNMVILGENALKGNVMDSVNYFIRTDRLPDSAAICACEGSAKDLLLTDTPLDSVSSFALEKILEQDYAKLDRIANVNIKNFADGYFSKSQRGFLPYVKTIPSGDAENASKGGNNGSGSQKEGENTGKGENAESKSNIYDASSAIIFSEGKAVGMLAPEETLLFNLKDKNSIDTFFKIDEAEIHGQKTPVLVELDETKKKYGFKFENGKPVYEITLEFQCRVVSANADMPVSELFPSAKASDEILRATEKKITETLEKIYRKIQLADCDLFGIKNTLYRFHYPRYNELKDNIIRSTVLKTNVVCKAKSTTRV